ncbi:alpha/beta hydrolase family protein [Actinomyces vulturis]|uniref:alpha/beta hydrolase family protein n=1 Tax=Actinomyces vulturis TaxID=1857645 RepID=UPI000833D212|nr:alpha/beta fold hydrolase [Actinomyces vulturis]
MVTVEITTPRGVKLEGTLRYPQGVTPPDDCVGPWESCTHVVVLFHDFLADRHGANQRLDCVSEAFLAAGYATLACDFSGLGDSDDDVITAAGEIEDVQAVCSWVREHDWPQHALYAHGFGATVTLLAKPTCAHAAITVGAVTAPQSILWEEVFGEDQLSELATHGMTRLLDDNPNNRTWNVISKTTLADVSLQTPQATMADLPWPILMIHGALDDEMPDVEESALEYSHVLPAGSKLLSVPDNLRHASESDRLRYSVEQALIWLNSIQLSE